MLIAATLRRWEATLHTLIGQWTFLLDGGKNRHEKFLVNLGGTFQERLGGRISPDDWVKSKK
jgi:hypothetical protein